MGVLAGPKQSAEPAAAARCVTLRAPHVSHPSRFCGWGAEGRALSEQEEVGFGEEQGMNPFPGDLPVLSGQKLLRGGQLCRTTSTPSLIAAQQMWQEALVAHFCLSRRGGSGFASQEERKVASSGLWGVRNKARLLGRASALGGRHGRRSLALLWSGCRQPERRRGEDPAPSPRADSVRGGSEMKGRGAVAVGRSSCRAAPGVSAGQGEGVLHITKRKVSQTL